jgi:purine-cytosine permease-like protein
MPLGNDDLGMAVRNDYAVVVIITFGGLAQGRWGVQGVTVNFCGAWISMFSYATPAAGNFLFSQWLFFRSASRSQIHHDGNTRPLRLPVMVAALPCRVLREIHRPEPQIPPMFADNCS